jgi:hypothetical protein
VDILDVLEGILGRVDQFAAKDKMQALGHEGSPLITGALPSNLRRARRCYNRGPGGPVPLSPVPCYKMPC